MKQYVIGIDIGTTCTKVVLVDETGAIVSTGSHGYPLITVGDQVEQRAEDWVVAAADAIRQAISGIDAAAIRGISCSTQGGSTVAVRADGSFIGNAWTWMDRRSGQQVQDLVEKLGSDAIYRATGSRMSAALDAAKIPNMRTREEYRDAVYYLTTLEVINRWLTGNPVIDPSNAAMRQLFSIEKMDWDDTILEAAGISRESLPDILPAGALVGRVTREAALMTGLPEGIPVYNGAHDQYWCRCHSQRRYAPFCRHYLGINGDYGKAHVYPQLYRTRPPSHPRALRCHCLFGGLRCFYGVVPGKPDVCGF